ncbi:MAG: hypothetical protein LBE80_01495, partial [Deltaproteobacteria bacterium]|nr:hypothetical protein [Deltaproteobacteria bacterium]
MSDRTKDIPETMKVLEEDFEEKEKNLREQAQIIKNIKIQTSPYELDLGKSPKGQSSPGQESTQDQEMDGLSEADSTRPFTVADFRLLASLWPLTKPFRKDLFWGIFMIVAAALVSLALPYLTKVAIDRHILPLGRLFYIESPRIFVDGKLSTQMVGRLRPEMFQKVVDGVWLLPSERADLIDRRQEKALVDQGLLNIEKMYFKQFAAPDGLGPGAAGL